MRELDKMKNTDIRTVDKSELTDIKDIVINPKLSVPERLESLLEQSKNPYCVIINGVAVKYTFSDNGVSLTERLKEYIKGKLN